jgi:hypothetical protein
MRNTIFSILAVIAIIASSCNNKELKLNYGLTFDETMKLAETENLPFCIILSKGDCSSCNKLHDALDKKLKGKVVINVVNTSSSANKWYEQWVGSMTSPMTCVFSKSGELTAIISGASDKCQDCIESALGGQAACADFLFKTPFTNGDNASTFKIMDKALKVKRKMEKGESVESDLEEIVNNLQYPYIIYLQCMNSKKQGKEDEAISYAKQLLTFIQPQYSVLYKDIFIEAKKIVNPDYDPNMEGKLKVESDIIKLKDCKVNIAKPFQVKLTNIGKKDLNIQDINVSCSCVKITGDKQYVLAPSESVEVGFIFTADRAGAITRYVNIITDTFEPVEQITIEAKAE